MKVKKTFSIISLGCFRNTYDSEILIHKLSRKGYVFSHSLTKAQKDDCVPSDSLIINTCGFIDKAKEESLDVIREAIEAKNNKKIKKVIVSGCLVKRYRKELQKEFPGVDEWLSVEELNQAFTGKRKLTPSYFAFLKICEGCLNRCSFCAIPLIKGNLRSKPLDEIIKEAKYLDRKGIRELNIIGQDITSWGKDFSKSNNLTLLIKRLLKETKNIKWIRLIYTHPRHLSDSLIELIANEERLCKYIDLPIQHINDRILKLMNRQITKEEITNLIYKIRKKIPGCAIRTSVIIGFPTETEDEFKELLQFVTENKFDRLGAFTYSREEGTPAYNLSPQVHPSIKKRRFSELMSLQERVVLDLNKRFLNQELDVLVEENQTDVSVGRTQYDAYEVDGCVFIKRQGLEVGSFYKVKITEAYGYDLIAA